MTSLRRQQGRLDVMTGLAVVIAVTAALAIGYLLGRRAGARPTSWRQRTSRAALVKQAAGLAVLVAVHRLRRSMRRRSVCFPFSARG